MFDYKLIEALSAVVNEEGFDKAASKLNITQSAISQRIKLLEDQTGQILIVRSSPPEATFHGKKILKHFQKVTQLESELKNELFSKADKEVQTITVGVNADSLTTWFMKAVDTFLKSHEYTIDLRVDDQDETDKMLKNGEVFGCIGSKKLSIQGCRSVYLGSMKYRSVATPLFIKKFFKNGLNEKSLIKAPAVIFNRRDMLHYLFFKNELGKEIKKFPSHYVPSSEKFFDFILKGYGYGMVPDLQSEEFLKKGEIKEISKSPVIVPLYWSCWNIKSKILKDFTKSLCSKTEKILY